MDYIDPFKNHYYPDGNVCKTPLKQIHKKNENMNAIAKHLDMK